jgi:flagellar basal-body rod modification protein FlgD
MADAIAALAGGSSTTPSASGRASVSRDQFLKILVAELTSQDPLEPLDNGDFMQQLVGLQNLEQTSALTDSLSGFQRFMGMASGSAMIGRTVKGVTEAGEAVEGLVTRVTVENDKVLVVAGGRKLPLGSVTEIRPTTA